GLYDQPPGAHLRVGERLLERRDRGEADVDVAKLCGPFGERLRAKRGAEEGEPLRALRALVPLLLDEILASEVPAEGRPEVRLVGADRDVPPVACLVDGIAGKVSGELRLPALGRVPREQVEQRVVDVPRHGSVEHGDVDELAAASALAGDERRQDADRRHERARADVGDLYARDDRRPARLADVVEDAGSGP